MKLQILHKRPECIGCNACVESAPTYWIMDKDGKSTLKDGERKGDFFETQSYDAQDEPSLREAQDSCPVQIIRIRKV